MIGHVYIICLVHGKAGGRDPGNPAEVLAYPVPRLAEHAKAVLAYPVRGLGEQAEAILAKLGGTRSRAGRAAGRPLTLDSHPLPFGIIIKYKIS
jgi:hypothetical protein